MTIQHKAMKLTGIMIEGSKELDMSVHEVAQFLYNTYLETCIHIGVTPHDFNGSLIQMQNDFLIKFEETEKRKDNLMGIKWISVEDEMPPKDRVFLGDATGEYNTKAIITFKWCTDVDKFIPNCDCQGWEYERHNWKITHWTELPNR